MTPGRSSSASSSRTGDLAPPLSRWARAATGRYRTAEDTTTPGGGRAEGGTARSAGGVPLTSEPDGPPGPGATAILPRVPTAPSSRGRCRRGNLWTHLRSGQVHHRLHGQEKICPSIPQQGVPVQPRSPIRRLAVAAMALSSTALALTGCGGGDSTDTSGGESAG